MGTNIVSGKFQKLDLESIQYYNDLYAFDDTANLVRFTPEGDGYYRYWFRRFGFKFEGIDPDTFITTVRDIGRLLFDQQDESSPSNEDSPEERAVWSLLEQGLHGEFTQALLNLAEARKVTSGERVVQLPKKSDRKFEGR